MFISWQNMAVQSPDHDDFWDLDDDFRMEIIDLSITLEKADKVTNDVVRMYCGL